MLHFSNRLTVLLLVVVFIALLASARVSAQTTVTLMQDNFDNSSIDSRWLVKWNNCSQDSVGSVAHAAGVADACGTTYGYAYRSATGDRCMVWKGSFSSVNHTDVKLTFWYKTDSGGSIDAYVLRNGSWTLLGAVGVAANWTKQEYSLTGTITGVRFDLKAGSSVTRRLDCVSITGNSSIASSGKLTGPFVAGTGSWSTLTNGGFESGNMSGWPATYSPQPGSIAASSARAARGTWSARSQATASGGFAHWQQNIPVFPGQTYVISGFFYTGGSTGATWLDLNDIPNDPEPTPSMNVNEWQFAWKYWTADRSAVNARIVRYTSNGVDAGVHYDEIAITPAHNFALPVQGIAPSITGHPQSQTVYEGDAVLFSVTATGTAPLSYQWRKGGSDITDAESASYSISSPMTGDSGSYDCVVTNAYGSATSNAAILTVNPLPIGEAKKRADAAGVILSDKTVTAVFADHFYIQDDSSSGIRVAPATMPTGLAVGDTVDVVGTLATTSDSERVVVPSSVDVSTGSALAPVSLTNKNLGGGDFFYDPGTGAGQKGVEDGVGVNNIGLLVKTCGTVTAVGATYFYIDDGTHARDFSIFNGIRVRCGALTKPASGDYICVSGISSIMKVNGRVFRSITPRDGDDIQLMSP